jgi:hypothetical protein
VGTMCHEPKLEDLLSDPILDVLLERDRVTLARVPREWWPAPEPQG